MHSVWTLYLSVFSNVVMLTLVVFVHSVKICSIPVSYFFLLFLREMGGGGDGQDKKKERERERDRERERERERESLILI